MARVATPPLTGAWHHDLAGGLRKRPLQERSKSMIQCILDTAAELVEEVGYEAVVGSPTLLLDRCGVSRGSFYAFFESPERVLDELCYQGIRLSTANLDAALWSRPGEHWVEIVDVLLDVYTTEHRTPLIRELWVRQNLTQRVRDLDHLAIDDLAALSHAQFRKHAPLFDNLTELHCRVAIHTVERLFQYAFIDDPDGDPAIIAEARRMLIDYYSDHAQL